MFRSEHRKFTKTDSTKRSENVEERLNEADIYGNSVCLVAITGHNSRRISILTNRFDLRDTLLNYFEKPVT